MANRVKCAGNLRSLGQAYMLYATTNGGAYPPDWGTLAKEEDITANVFVCPDDTVVPPSDLPPDQLVLWVNQNSSYIYLGADPSRGNDPNRIIA